MADVSGKFFSAKKVRTGVSPSSPGVEQGETLPPVNPPGGGLNSVGLTMPSAFEVANSPLTSNGTIAVTGAGTVSQYVRGDGSLADFPESIGSGASVSYYLNGSVNQGTIGGVTYYEMNKTPIIGAGTDFTRNSNGYIASFLTDANDPALLVIPAGNWNFETYFQASSGGGSPTFYLELYKYDGTTFSLIASNSGSPKLINDGTQIEAYFSALAVPQTTLTLTDRLAIRIYVTTSNRTITLHTENGHLCQVITTFTTGLSALNGLTSQVQFFAVGTSGTNFNIASATDTHTFNLPTASATNRGALSSTDWSTFNNKQNQLNGTGFVKANGTTISYDNSTYQVTSEKGQPNGYASLDGNGKVPLAQINDALIGNVNYQGLWNAATNNPTLVNPPSSGTKGYYYIVSTAGTFASISFEVGDWIISNGSAWQKVDNTDAVSSVFGRTGNVVAANGDYNTSQVTENTNLYFTQARVSANTDVAANTAARHNAVTLGVTNGLGLSGQQLSLQLATGSQNGALSSTDWTTFNSKENAITAGTTAQYFRGDKTFQTLNTSVVPESGNLYFTQARVSANTDVAANTAARHNAVTLGTANGLSLSTQQLSLGLASAGVTGALSGTDWSTFNSKQQALNGTGFVKISGTTISYDNTSYLPLTGGTLTGQLISTFKSSTGALVLTSGDDTTRTNNFVQITLGYNGANIYKHFITTRHNSEAGTGNSIDFYTSDRTLNGTFPLNAVLGLRVENGNISTGGITATGNITGANLSGINTGDQTLSGLGGVPTSRTITINGTTQDLSDNRIYNVGTVTSVAALTLGTSGTDLSSSVANGTTTPVITLNVPTASASNRGALSAADWTTFNNKQNALTNPVTGTGDANYLPRFTGTTTIGNSGITDDGSTITLLSRALSGSSGVFSGAVETNRISTGNVTPFINVGVSIRGTITGNNDTWGVYAHSLTHAPIANNALAVGFGTGGTINRGTYTGLSYRGFYQLPISVSGSGTLATAYGMYIESLSGATNNYSAYFSQNVGIGNATPSYLLDVAGTSRFIASQPDIILDSTNNTEYSRLVFLENGATKGGIEYINSSFSEVVRRNKLELFSNTGIHLIPDGSFTAPVLSLTGTGSTFRNNLGIAGAAPTYPLTVFNGSNGTTAAIGGTARGLRVDNDGVNSVGMTSLFGVDNSFYGSYQPIRLAGSTVYLGIGHTNNVVTITPSGRVLVNTPTESTFQLDVNGTGRFSGDALYVFGTGNIEIGRDTTYSTPYMTVGFGGRSNGFNRIYGARDTTDGLYLSSATGRGIRLLTNGDTVSALTLASTGAATFSSSVTAPSFISDGGGSEGVMRIERDTVGTNAIIGALNFTNNNGATIYGRVRGGRNSAGDGYVSLGTGVGDNLYALEGGNVGIGTASPTSGAGWTPTLVLNAIDTALLVKGANGQENSFGTSNGLYIDCLGNSTGTNNNIIFRSTSVNSSFSAFERMRITSDGNIRLTSNNASNASFDLNYRFSTPDSARIRFSTTSNFNQNEPGELSFWTRANDAQGGGLITERMRITSGGELQVKGNGVIRNEESGGNFSYWQQTSSDVRFAVQYSQPLRFFTNNTEAMRITAAGRVLIGTPPPTESIFQLDVNGGARFTSGVTSEGNLNIITTNTPTQSILTNDIPSNNNTISLISFGARWNSTTYGTGAQIRATAAGTWSSTNYGSNLIFSTVTQNTDVNTSRMIIAASGTVTITNLAGSGSRMVVADANGVLSTQAIGSGAITGSGTSGTISLFTGTSSIGNSEITQLSSNIGIRNTNPQAYLDVAGIADQAGFNNLILRAGNSDVAAPLSNQILFGYAGTMNYAHAIKTRAQSGSQAGNAFDFYVWKYGDSLTTPAGQRVMAVEGNGVRIANSGGTLINPVSSSVLTVNGNSYSNTLQTSAPTGTNNIEWKLGRAVLATSADPEDRWIRVQLGTRVYDILAIDRGLA